jgi:hypothetical protein
VHVADKKVVGGGMPSDPCTSRSETGNTQISLILPLLLQLLPLLLLLLLLLLLAAAAAAAAAALFKCVHTATAATHQVSVVHPCTPCCRWHDTAVQCHIQGHLHINTDCSGYTSWSLAAVAGGGRGGGCD